MQKIFKTKAFDKFARKSGISDEMLLKAVERANRGLIDADLGHSIIKQCIAREGEGRSGGYRTLIFYQIKNRSYFVAGFAKNQQQNLSDTEFTALKALAKVYQNLTDDEINLLVQQNRLIEIRRGMNDR
ncbi:TPA: type II toxin-antitoxin system RelE/ParE family toxin [Mannheimia haemolytica]